MFLDQQIIILEWFLKDHVTLKTGEIQLYLLEINYILEIKVQNNILNCTYI